MHVQFAELPVFDQDRAKAFYVDRFDAEVTADQPMSQDGWRWIELKCPGAQSALHFLRRSDETTSATPVLVLVDEEVEATVERLRSEGVTILAEPHRPPWRPTRVVAEFQDSEGNRVVLGSP